MCPATETIVSQAPELIHRWTNIHLHVQWFYCLNRGATHTPRTDHKELSSTQLDLTTVKSGVKVKFTG